MATLEYDGRVEIKNLTRIQGSDESLSLKIGERRGKESSFSLGVSPDQKFICGYHGFLLADKFWLRLKILEISETSVKERAKFEEKSDLGPVLQVRFFKNFGEKYVLVVFRHLGIYCKEFVVIGELFVFHSSEGTIQKMKNKSINFGETDSLVVEMVGSQCFVLDNELSLYKVWVNT